MNTGTQGKFSASQEKVPHTLGEIDTLPIGGRKGACDNMCHWEVTDLICQSIEVVDAKTRSGQWKQGRPPGSSQYQVQGIEVTDTNTPVSGSKAAGPESSQYLWKEFTTITFYSYTKLSSGHLQNMTNSFVLAIHEINLQRNVTSVDLNFLSILISLDLFLFFQCLEWTEQRLSNMHSRMHILSLTNFILTIFFKRSEINHTCKFSEINHILLLKQSVLNQLNWQEQSIQGFKKVVNNLMFILMCNIIICQDDPPPFFLLLNEN